MIDIATASGHTRAMSPRLQVVIDQEELEAIRSIAERRGVTVSEVVREALREARRKVGSGDSKRKLAAIRSAFRHTFPTSDINRMLGEIDGGHGAHPELPPSP